jgi:hypothetical protein
MRRTLLALCVLTLPACTTQSVAMPSYEPRPVAVPAECDRLIQRATSEGLTQLRDDEQRTVLFCQQQQLVRAAEEEAAARKLDAHARTAGLAMQVATVVIGATIAVIAWAF